jgi:hypothetical protein
LMLNCRAECSRHDEGRCLCQLAIEHSCSDCTSPVCGALHKLRVRVRC